MGQFPTNSSFISRALAYTPTNTIDPRSAWLFENQSGTLGTFLSGSSVYVGVTGTVRGIVAGTEGVQGTVVLLGSILTAGAAYFTATGLLTTVTSIVPASSGTGCTVDITVPIPTTNALVPGTGYSVGPFTVTEAGGLTGTIDTITGGGATGPIGTFTITRGGSGYAVADVLTIVDGGGTGGSITLATAPNGAVTAVIPRAAGQQYAIGDILTVTQAGSDGNCTIRIDAVQSLSPVAGDAIEFLGAQAGTILPVVFDYILVPGAAAATNLIVGK